MDSLGHGEGAVPDASGAHAGAEAAGVGAVVGGAADDDHAAFDLVQGHVGRAEEGGGAYIHQLVCLFTHL